MKRPSPSPSLSPSLSGCSLAELEAQITELAGQLNAANYRWLRLIGEFDRRQGWADGSLHSCAHWLNFKCGLDLGAAREKVRVASALPGLPKIAAATPRPRAGERMDYELGVWVLCHQHDRAIDRAERDGVDHDEVDLLPDGASGVSAETPSWSAGIDDYGSFH
jgi:hypothetical protein